MLVIRLLLTGWAIVYPDVNGVDSFFAVQVTTFVNGVSGNDAYYYWIIAQYGFLPGMGFEWRLINFSPVFPFIEGLIARVIGLYSPFVLNSVFVVLTPFVLVPFLENVIKDGGTARKMAVIILFNPIFQAYAIFGLTEPLHFLLIFTVMLMHYRKGILWRVAECVCLSLLVLNRFIAVILAVFYAYKAIFDKGIAIKTRLARLVPAAVLLGTYVAYELACSIIFGHTPSEARRVYWGHDFNFNPFSPTFPVQLPILLAGACIGALVLRSHFFKNDALKEEESALFSRLDVQALMAYAAITIIFLGSFNKQISVLRYCGTLFPLLMVFVLPMKISGRMSLASFVYTWVLTISHVAALPVVFIELGITVDVVLHLVLPITFTAAFLVAYMVWYFKKRGIESNGITLAWMLLLSLLIMPFAIMFP